MYHFVAISTPLPEIGRRNEFLDRAVRAIEHLDSGPDLIKLDCDGCAVVYQTPPDQRVARRDGAFAFLCEPATYMDSKAGAITAEEFLTLFRDRGSELGRVLVPPLGALVFATKQVPVSAMTDRQGLHHLYSWQGDGVAAVSSSPLILGVVARETIDVNAIGKYALVGHYLGLDTVVRNVRKIPAHCILRLSEGRLSQQSYDSDSSCFTADASDPDEGAVAISNAMRVCLDSFDRPLLELSGGLDSRFLLAAIPKDERRGLAALTLGTPVDPDWRIAREMAQREGLEHQLVDLTALVSLTAEDVLDLAITSSLRHSHMANPLETGALEFVRRRVGSAPRLSGQNGEFARGFYYPGQRLDSESSPSAIRRLVDWRVAMNAAVSGSIFNRGFMRESREVLISFVETQFEHYPRKWARALDEYYLDSRIQRWVGLGASAAACFRVTLYPYFHSDFIRWVRGLDSRLKGDSSGLCTALGILDPKLAELPLDSGLSPRALSSRSPVSRLRRRWQTTIRMGRKVIQRLGHSTRPAVGARGFVDKLMPNLPELAARFSRLAEHDLFEPAGIEKFGSGAKPTPATLGLLLSVHWALEFLERDWDKGAT